MHLVDETLLTLEVDRPGALAGEQVDAAILVVGCTVAVDHLHAGQLDAAVDGDEAQRLEAALRLSDVDGVLVEGQVDVPDAKQDPFVAGRDLCVRHRDDAGGKQRERYRD